MKDRKLSIRISEDDLIKIHAKAAKSKLNFTQYVTKACLGRQIFVVEGLDEVLRQQKAIGRNQGYADERLAVDSAPRG